MPGAEITLTVLNEAGEVVESKPLEFYRGEFYHYANNFGLPGSGTYALRAEIEPSAFLCAMAQRKGKAGCLPSR